MWVPDRSPPANAPTKGPNIIPNGPNQNPAINPIPAPQTTFLFPPVRLVLQIGNRLSNIAIRIVNNPITIISIHETRCPTDGTNLSKSIPNHDNGGPGRTGKTDPTIPTTSRIIAKAIKSPSNISGVKMELKKNAGWKLYINVSSKHDEVLDHDLQFRTDKNRTLCLTNLAKSLCHNGNEHPDLHT